MNILSLFDGISCGQQALNRIWVKYNNYFSSEIDKYAIGITQYNYPNTIQLGDIRNIKKENLPEIDLIIGGSPCQGFSFAGKGLNFDDPRSKLFFEFVRLLKECKPKYFLLENVVMGKKENDIISSILGEIYPECVKQKEFFRMGRLEPIMINSALVSAQQRKRLYWTNIKNINQPEDKNIYLKDIIEKGIVDRNKSYCIDKSYWKGTNIENYIKKKRRQIVFCDAFRGRHIENGKRKDIKGSKTEQILEIRNDQKTNTITSVQKDNILIFQKPEKIGDLGKGQGYRVFSENGKSVTLMSGIGGWGSMTGLYYINDNIRKLTPIECERLQTIPDNYTKYGIINNKKVEISKTQRYKTLGNGWTIDIIVHILKNMDLF